MKVVRLTQLIVIATVVVGVMVWQLVGNAQEKTELKNEDGTYKYTNELAQETSPYLLQHKHNPVHWVAWSDKAFARAKAEDKPIFLSVGYSTCHWCHVMAEESFESKDVADILNKHFICIKVDREELPDVDEQYMLATQVFFAVQGVPRAGGWPNSVWLTPDRRPWYAGTYFPKTQFINLLNHAATIWKDRRPDVEKQAAAMAQYMERQADAAVEGDDELNPAIFQRAARSLAANYDETNGGFGGAPKFPPHGTLALLTRHYESSKKSDDLNVITHTLDRMRLGGVWDHVGGGFHRYATDANWFLPHFEKMLYDNAQLIRAYTDGHRLTKEADYKRVVNEIFQWLQREMTDKAGGFYSAQDADSPVSHDSDEHEEGLFYVWTPKQIHEVLEKDDAELFIKVYGIQEGGNFVDERTRQKTGDSIPFLAENLDVTADEMKTDEATLRKRLSEIRGKLMTVRAKRPPPGLDDKVLTSWNGLMIGALAYAGRHLGEPKYTEAATRAAEFTLAQMRDKDGRLYRTWRNGKAKLPGYLNDYAFMANGFLQLYTATGDQRWLTEAAALTDVMIQDFADTKRGGFYFSSSAHDKLMFRSKGTGGGGNIPSGNGVAARVLTELAVLTDKRIYADQAAKTLQSHAGIMSRQPFQAEHMILALNRYYELAEVKKLPRLGPDDQELMAADAVARQGPLTMQLFLSHDQVKPGATVSALVRVEIQSPYHIYANPAGFSKVIPTAVTLEAEAATLGEVQYPNGQAVKDKAWSGAEISIYEGSVDIIAPIVLSKDATGDVVLKIKVSAQPCDDMQCLAEIRRDLEFTIRVAPDADGELRHVEYFKSSAFRKMGRR